MAQSTKQQAAFKKMLASKKPPTATNKIVKTPTVVKPTVPKVTVPKPSAIPFIPFGKGVTPMMPKMPMAKMSKAVPKGGKATKKGGK
jgi:hypothetical protein